MSPPLFPAAKKGDRFSHNARANERAGEPLLGALLGQSLSLRGCGGALLAQVGAGASCASASGSTLSITELLPGSTSGTIEGASPTVLVAPGLGAALADADPVECGHHSDKPIAPGTTTTTILVQGLALARSGGETGCGAILCDGAPTVLAGGPAATGAGSGTRARSLPMGPRAAPNPGALRAPASGTAPISDAIAYADSLAGKLAPCLASTRRGASLIEPSPDKNATTCQNASLGAQSALTGALTSVTRGGTLGVLAGGTLVAS